MSTHYTEFTGMPLVLGDVRGVRSWDVDQLGRLISPTYRTVWTPGENGAECKKLDDYGVGLVTRSMMRSLSYSFTYDPPGAYTYATGGAAASAPAPAISEEAVKAREKPHTQEKCACGFYAYSNGRNDYADTTRLTGVIQGFGETQLGTRGFKSSRAKILALHVPSKAAKIRSDQVSTHSTHFERVIENYPNVQVFAKYADMLDAFPTYEHVPTPETDDDFWTRGI